MAVDDRLAAEVEAVMSACGKESSTYHHYLIGGGKRDDWRTDYSWLTAAIEALCKAAYELGMKDGKAV